VRADLFVRTDVTVTTPARHEPPAFLGSSGELARLISRYDWSATLGPLDDWPSSLKTTVSLMIHSPVPMVLLWGPLGYMLYNDAYSVFAGGRHPALLGSEVRKGWPEVASFNDNVMRVGLAGGTLSYKDQELTLNRTGTPKKAWMDLDYSPVMDESGEPGGVIAIVVETTERVLSQQRLAAATERQRRQFEQAPGFVIIMSGPDHVVEFVNETHRRVFGSHDWVGKPIREAFVNIEGEDFLDQLGTVYATGETFEVRGAELRFRRSAEAPVERRFLSFMYAAITDESGAVTGIFCDGFDVTERELATAALRESEALFRFLDRLGRATARSEDANAILAITTRSVGEYLDVANCAYADMDPDQDGFTIRGDWSTPSSPSMMGHYRLADFGDLAVGKLRAGEPFIVNDNHAELEPAAAAAFEAIGVAATVCMPLVKEGRLTALMAIHDKRPRTWTAHELAVIREVTERSWAHIERVAVEAELRANVDNFRTLARAMPNHVWTARPDGHLDWFNERVYAYSGAEPGTLDGLNWTTIVHPDDAAAAGERWTQALTTSSGYEAQFRIRRADGAWRWHIARAIPLKGEFGEVVRWIGTNTDIQDQKEIAEALRDLNATLEERVQQRTRDLVQTQDALRQAQKMEAVGQLTGGIAHDFNNLLMGVTGSLQLLARRLQQGTVEGSERYIEAAQASARRAASLTQRLLAFSRRQTLDPKATDVNRLIGGIEELIRRSIGPTIELEVVGAGGLWATRVDRSQLENSLLNLCINARDAMTPDGGRLTIETANKWLDQHAARERDLPPGQYVSLCVSDTGTGMPPDVIERAFDPFFTTKPLGQGTGLGLSMVYGFVRQSGGQVRIYSELRRGTTVCLYLPRHGGDAGTEDERNTDAPSAGHGETVLVIDDEPTVRMLVMDTLEESGYRVLAAEDGPRGLALLRSPERVDLVITDVGLPGGMNGRQVADAARLLRPGLKVLFITGYAENAVVGNGHLEPNMAIMTKPFNVADLANRVRDLIDR